MGIKFLDKLGIAMAVLALVALIMMNVFTLSVIMFNVVRVLLVISWVTSVIIFWITHKR
jgi:hypothetical protein